MRLNSSRTVLALLLLAPLLAGCLERGQPTMADSSGDDDAITVRLEHVRHALHDDVVVVDECHRDRLGHRADITPLGVYRHTPEGGRLTSV